MRRGVYIYTEEMSRHVLREDHPFRPIRLQHTYELLECYGAFGFSNSSRVEPRHATEEEIFTFHTPDYLAAVQSFSRGKSLVDPGRYNFNDYGDNPTYRGMYEAAALAVGGSLVAADLLLEDSADVAFNPAGGLHHAAHDRASGFCVFNDAVIAIKHLLAKGLKIAYVDIDVHHGDGVQNAFYDTDQVLTISVHESGRYLFPGTGSISEIGSGKGRGFSANLPLAPYTEDETYLEAFREIVLPLVRKFKPDILVSQLGIDTHFSDPLAHLNLTSDGFSQAVAEQANLSPKWLTLGGGGYSLDAVARCWTLAYGVMIEQEWPDQIPAKYRQHYKVSYLRDHKAAHLEAGLLEQVRCFARESVQHVKSALFPFHGL